MTKVMFVTTTCSCDVIKEAPLLPVTPTGEKQRTQNSKTERKKTTMKKFIAILISVMLVLSLSVVAFAESDGPAAPAAPTYSITIDNAVNGETYTAYKIFDVTYSGTNADPGTLPAAPNADPRHLSENYSYTITSSSEWWNVIVGSATADASGVYTANGLTFTPTSPTGTYIVEEAPGFDAAALAALLNQNTTGKTAAASQTASGTTVTLDVTTAGAGYYFVDTSLGSLCSLDTTEPTATIREKNTTTSEDKTVKEDSSTNYGDKNDVDLGQTVEFQTEVVIGKHQSNVVFHDIMQSQLALDPTSIKVYTDSSLSTELASTNYTIYTAAASTIPADAKYTGDTFAIAFTNAYTEALAADTTLYVVYTATLTPDAIVGDQAGLAMDAGNDNKASVTYGDNQRTEWDWTRTYTWGCDVYKYTGDMTPAATEYAAQSAYTDAEAAAADGFSLNAERTGTDDYWVKTTAASDGTPLADATFELRRTNDGSPIAFVDLGNNVYRLAVAGDTTTVTAITTDSTGRFTLQGLDADTYYLVETAAPAGYNMLKDPIQVVIDSNSDSAQTTQNNGSITLRQNGDEVDEIDVQNNTGSELPSTGGIGTYIFYIAGAILVLGAAIVLIARKRSAATEA